MKRLLIFLPFLLMLASCSGMPKLFWDVDEGKDQPAYAGAEGGSQAASRKPLTVPPELRSELELPQGEAVGTQAQGPVAEKYRQAVAGKAVRLDARLYENHKPAEVFSAVVDAMTAMNVPLDSVDSPSGIITSDWIRQGSTSSYVLFGFGGNKLTRYKYLVRVYRATGKDGASGTQLEIRTIGQVFETGQGWVTQPIRNKPVNELFDAVGEQLARVKPQMEKAAPATKPEAAAEAKTPEDEALAAVEAWRRAWSAREAEAYLAAYAPDFQPPRGFATLGDWQAYKKRVIASKSFIEVTLEDALATRQPDGSVSVEFLQHFRSNNFNSDDRKRLVLKKIGPDWKIIRETSL